MPAGEATLQQAGRCHSWLGGWVGGGRQGVTPLTCMPLVVLQHVDLLGKLAVALFTLVLFNPLVKLHVVPQSVFGLHSCGGGVTHTCSVLPELHPTTVISPTFATFCTQEVPDVVVDPEVLLQHVLPGEGLVTLVTAMALHT